MSIVQYCTVVFQVTDQDKAKDFLSPIVQTMGEDIGPAAGVRVTAVSMRDEITAVEALEAGHGGTSLPDVLVAL
ncbi:hypothetical protein [Stenotrophomonas maltophilia]|uniref:hypothetical protein n=1 Tax=Stenotrophomonas maltophilia TaxID=40324 RepID=UPI00244C711E|nr:hypothetical protein [Stenotrophomonas maltophilia]MDH0740914.1 hypothetical protein [Stenotrophomonas maltophilia]MDH1328350.1 hypothetical protein [Stenotrophomonas maltophilia]